MGTALITDLYELTMAQSYLEHEQTGSAVFSLFSRKLPDERNFLVACGLEVLISQIEQFRFGSDDLEYLAGLGMFSDDFLDWLRSYRFSGTISALPEGTIFFQNEPIVQVEGALPEVQLLETLVMNSIQFQTMIASKAARIMNVARETAIIDFGFRRAHMVDAGIYAARAAYIAGFSGTSNLEAGKRFGIPVFGTMAHSYVMVFSREEDAFRAFSTTFPDKTLFLIDTYDTIAAAKKVVALAKSGITATGVRIDSGDIPSLAAEVRKILDQDGLDRVKIFATSSIDENSIAEWLDAGAPIDSFGVGTKFITSSDAPYLDMVYKLVEYEGKPMFKKSPGKKTFPYKRQIVRHRSGNTMHGDEVVRMMSPDETPGLVIDVMKDGTCKKTLPTLDQIRSYVASEIGALPCELRSLRKEPYPVTIRP
jgi:nicotinate phosphoribosyltransferase